jgi:hypothetical protein
MVPLNLNVEMVVNDNSGESKLFISIKDDQKTLNQQVTKDVFARLVPAKNYKITVEKMVSGSFSSQGEMTIELVGQNRGAGNGQFVPVKTWLPEGTTLVSTAGQKGSVRFVLRQSEDKRFNQLFNPTTQVELQMDNAVQTWRDNGNPDPSKKYNFWIEENDDYNDFTISCYTTTASEIRDDIVFFLYVTDLEGQKHRFAQNITLYIKPEVPDLSKTVITRDMPEKADMEELNQVRFKIFDKYSNPIRSNDAEFLRNFVVKPIQGTLTYNETEFDAELGVVRKLFGINDQNEYSVNIQQNYPPRVMKFDILYIMSYD